MALLSHISPCRANDGIVVIWLVRSLKNGSEVFPFLRGSNDDTSCDCSHHQGTSHDYAVLGTHCKDDFARSDIDLSGRIPAHIRRCRLGRSHSILSTRITPSGRSMGKSAGSEACFVGSTASLSRTMSRRMRTRLCPTTKMV